MPRIQVYLPDDLYNAVKSRDLPASELLQKAVRAEVRRLELVAESDRYVTELIAESGPPSRSQLGRARAIVRRLARKPARRAG